MRHPCAIAFAVYNGADNSIALALEGEDGAILASLAALTRATLQIGATVIDSAVAGSSVVWWTDQAVFRRQTVDVLKFRLGHQGLSAGTFENCELTTFDAININGVRYHTPFDVTVHA